MKSDNRDPEHRVQAPEIELWSHASGGAATGALMGVLFVFLVGPRAVAWVGFPVQWWHGLLAGAVLGSLFGILRSLIRFYRARFEFNKVMRLESHSRLLGLKPLAGAERGMIASRIEKLLDTEVSQLSAYFNENEFANVVTGDVRFTRRVRSTEIGEPDNVSHSMHSYVYIRFDGHSIPHFKLMPETIFKRIADKFLKRDIDFDDSPGFSRAYHLESKSVDDCRQLFDRPVRRELENKKDWEIYGQGSWLVFLRRKRFGGDQDQQDYLRDCLVVANLFHESLTKNT